jgi:hypothetical protein
MKNNNETKIFTKTNCVLFAHFEVQAVAPSRSIYFINSPRSFRARTFHFVSKTYNKVCLSFHTSLHSTMRKPKTYPFDDSRAGFLWSIITLYREIMEKKRKTCFDECSLHRNSSSQHSDICTATNRKKRVIQPWLESNAIRWEFYFILFFSRISSDFCTSKIKP